MKPLTIRVPEPLHREARVLSVQTGESLNALVNKWLASWVAHHKESA
jgi:predicted HicB family RNase H-like nuclease